MIVSESSGVVRSDFSQRDFESASAHTAYIGRKITLREGGRSADRW